jgi:phosphoserine phosphatase
MTERKIALYDIDKTSYRGLLIKDFVKYQVLTGTLDQKVADKITNEEDLYLKGKPYEEMAQDMLIHWAGGLKGKKNSIIESEANKFFKTPDGNKFFLFVQESINLLRPTHDTYFVTAEPQFVADEVSKIHQATKSASTIFEITKDGLFTGKIAISLAKRQDKGNKAKELIRNHLYEQSFAFGDSDGDIEMLEGVEYPICVNPNDKLVEKAIEKKWEIKKPEEVVLFVRSKLLKT